MGLNNADSYRSSLVFDLETYPIDDAAVYLEPAAAPSNYSKPEAIARYVEKANAEQLSKCALDPDLCRIVALGLYQDANNYAVRLAPDVEQERAAITAFWDALGTYPYPMLIGFNCLLFDLPVLVQRSRYLGIPTKPLQMAKFRHPDVTDLMMILNFDGAIKSHSLKFYARRFGIPVDDAVSGKDIGALVAADQWEAVAAHCKSDILTTAALAVKLNVLRTAVEMVL